jgi:uncharacterized protein (DUF2249 family)
MTDSTYPNLLDDATAQEAVQEGGCGGNCTCGEQADAAPELDARQIPPAIRHASIFGALSAVRPGDSMILIAPHAPIPLLEQIEAAEPGVWTSSISQAGPEEFRVRLTRAR